jgi:demethylspheroidene O-methyltransferase
MAGISSPRAWCAWRLKTVLHQLARSAPQEDGIEPVRSLYDRWLTVRDRLLASAAFRRWATAFPLTRPIARRRATALFDLGAGFVYAQVLAACVRLRLFDLLAEGPQTLAALAPRLGLAPDAAERLLAAAAALDLASRRSGGRFGLGPLGAAVVDNPGVAAMIEHHALLYADLADPVALLRGEAGETELMRYWAYARSSRPGDLEPDAVARYSALMAASQPMVAAEILAAYPLAAHRCLLDVGGGEGAFLAAAAAGAPNLRLMLFDLPPVAERARARFAAAGLAARAEATGGNFLADPLPRGADIVSLVRVIHDHDDAAAMTILRAVLRALPDGGTLLLAEPMAETSGARATGDAYFGFYLLAMGSGRPRTAARLSQMLADAGFSRVRNLATRTPMLTRLIVAQP